MALFNMQSYLHALNIFNLTKGQAPAEVFHADHLPQQIANARLNQINQNANEDLFDEQLEATNRERVKARKLMGVACMVASDRTALMRTIEHIEKRLRRGEDIDQVMREAQKFRATEFDAILADPDRQDAYKRIMGDMPNDANEGRRVLVQNTPIVSKGR